jgi:hypothetical protein
MPARYLGSAGQCNQPAAGLDHPLQGAGLPPLLKVGLEVPWADPELRAYPDHRQVADVDQAADRPDGHGELAADVGEGE